MRRCFKKNKLTNFIYLTLYKGTIALDDISFDDGACTKQACDFESPDICGYTNDPSGNFDWTRNKGPTASFGTGYLVF